MTINLKLKWINRNFILRIYKLEEIFFAASNICRKIQVKMDLFAFKVI